MLAAGIYFLFLSYRMYQRGGKISTMTIALVGVLAIAGAQEWVQGFLKTEAIQLLIGYSAKLNTFHKTVGELEAKVRQHQGELDAHQVAISNQAARIASAQLVITNQQDKIDRQQSLVSSQAVSLAKAQQDVILTAHSVVEQQKKLDDVEYLVKNLFENTVFERFDKSETNRVLFINYGSGAYLVILRLKNTPFKNSLHGDFENFPVVGKIDSLFNIAIIIFAGNKSNAVANHFGLSYVTDTRAKINFNNFNPVPNDNIILESDQGKGMFHVTNEQFRIDFIPK